MTAWTCRVKVAEEKEDGTVVLEFLDARLVPLDVLKRLLSLVQSVEWAGYDEYDLDYYCDHFSGCPSCSKGEEGYAYPYGTEKKGHAPECELNAALGTLKNLVSDT